MLGNFSFLTSEASGTKSKKYFTKQNIERIVNHMNQFSSYNNVILIQDYCDKEFNLKIEIPVKNLKP